MDMIRHYSSHRKFEWKIWDLLNISKNMKNKGKVIENLAEDLRPSQPKQKFAK